MSHRLTIGAFLLLAACSKTPSKEQSEAGRAAAPAAIVPVATEAPAGTYRLDKAHASLVFTVDHVGFSNYTGEFKRFDATLEFDPKNAEAMSVTATIDPSSLDVPSPPEGFVAELLGQGWLDASQFPEMTFKSTAVELTGPQTAKIAGDFALHGVTLPVDIEARYNGGYKGFPPYDPNARIGFSASGSLSRSAFGLVAGLPPEGSTMGVGDTVSFAIEAEFNGPAVEGAVSE